MPLGKAAHLPRNHGVGAVVLAAARGRAAAAARPCARDPGLATRSCAAAEGARRPSRPLACQARPAALPWQHCAGDPEARCTIDDRSRKQDWRRFGGFFAVFAVAIWRWRKRLKFNVGNSVGAPGLLSARQKLAW